MATVKFNAVDEFIEELKKSQPWPRIVRLTYLSRQSSVSPNIRHLFVVSTFVVTAWLSTDKSVETLVRLDKFCGDTWGLNTEEDKKVQERAEVVVKQIEDACREVGYEVRAGVFEEAGHGQG